MVALAGTLHMEYVVTGWNVGIAHLLLPEEGAPMSVKAFQVSLVNDVVLVAVVDALEVHQETVVIVAESYLSLLSHLVKIGVPDAVVRDALNVDVCDF